MSVADKVMLGPRGVEEMSVPVKESISSSTRGAVREHKISGEGQSTPSPTRRVKTLDGEKACAPATALQVFVSAEAAERSGHADGAGEPAGQYTL